MKRPEHFPENIFCFKMIDVPAEWQDRSAICKQLCLKEERKEGRKESRKEEDIWCVSISICMCAYTQKKSFFNMDFNRH